MLSLLPLAKKQANLTYSSLQSALSLPSAQALEQLVTKAIYTGLIAGTLDPHHQVVNITSVAPLRDLAPGSIPALAQSLTTWSTQCTAMLALLEAQIKKVKYEAQKNGTQKERVQGMVDERIAAAEKEGEHGRPKRSAGQLADLLNVAEENDDDAMDLDQNDGRRIGRSSKRGGFGISRMSH